jgi:hypothetical protein
MALVGILAVKRVTPVAVPAAHHHPHPSAATVPASRGKIAVIALQIVWLRVLPLAVTVFVVALPGKPKALVLRIAAEVPVQLLVQVILIFLPVLQAEVN